ncbi:3'(2'),5'-bisphosphate nucleotidase CysQ [bacterium]|nr:3'(2'),5'-bisphosphate nucleotidase CysQ [bacterium]MCI0604995.1 3'(2'),5'-bisphosphate nucleotidase CysQ [bacterium]
MEEELVSLARKAGKAVREVFEKGTWETTFKSDQSPLTEADRASHRILTEGLSLIAPGVPILSEEAEQISYEIRKDWEYYFLIDPVDGTREFVRKVPEFAINVALIQKGRPIVGIVHSPLEGISYYARRGSGAYRIGENREALPVGREDSDRIRVLLSHTDKTPGLNELMKKLPDPTVARMGSSLKFCAVAEGKADFYPRLKPSMEWDTAAGTILVEESGGIVCELTGERIEYNRQVMLNPPFFVLGKSLFQKMPDWKERLFERGAFQFDANHK